MKNPSQRRGLPAPTAARPARLASGNHLDLLPGFTDAVLQRHGELKVFARNVRSDSEFCGICFDPTGRHMFVNLQEDGLTLRVSGPFDSI